MAYEAAIIKTVVAFEKVILDLLVVAINNDTSILSAKMQINLPKHLTHDVCEYLITGTRYFDWTGGRSGLIRTVKTYVPNSHWLVTTVSDIKFTGTFERLLVLRNHAAHESKQSKRAVNAALNTQIVSVGAWLSKGNRMRAITTSLKQFGADVQLAAPY